MNPSPLPPRARLDRRTAIKWMLTVASTAAVPAWAQPSRPPTNQPPGPFGPATPVPPLPHRPGYGTDPDLMRAYQAGDCWPLTLTVDQRALVTVLADLILPADERSPPASAVGVPDFIDEWISAPYVTQAADRVVILQGLEWINAEATRRFGESFAALATAQQTAICDDICRLPAAAPEWAAGSAFFDRLRFLVMAGYYTTPEGMRDLRYVGNLPSATFEGPPQAVLDRLGLDGQVPA